MAYAEKTVVSVDKSRLEIERILARYKADQFATAIDNDAHRAMIQFRCQGRIIRFEMGLPTQDQALRTRWRALCLTIKAKLESVESRIETFDDAFMPHIVMPNGDTFGHWAKPQIHKAIESGQMPQSLMLEDRRGPTD